jgi:sulfite reductase alpha subunit
MKKYDTPLVDELEKGPWPSFVKEIKRAAATNEMANDELGQIEKSFKTKRGYWKHGGIVGVLGYGGGVIGRYSSLPEEFPGVAHFHTVRINQPSGFFYKTDSLREIMNLWDKYGSGLTNMHGSTGDMVMLGCRTEALEPFFAEVSSRGWDLGLRVVQRGRHGHLQRHDPEVPGRAPQAHVPLQVQDQGGRMRR